MSDEGLTLVPMPDSIDRPSIDYDDETSALAGRTSSNSSSLLRSPGESTPGRSRSISFADRSDTPSDLEEIRVYENRHPAPRGHRPQKRQTEPKHHPGSLVCTALLIVVRSCFAYGLASSALGALPSTLLTLASWLLVGIRHGDGNTP